MQRSSESIGSLATALAKAQSELVNPEKLLVGTIRVGQGEAAERSFRYASLSSGLDIVRKTLGQHEIATVQTTAIDQTAGTVNLTTVLAHSSGEWISSDWPVCAVSEIAIPRRMGAALTYARRYSLFTLVGIAGEDDLDAPDLAVPTPKTAEPETSKGTSNGRLNGTYHGPAQDARRAVSRPNSKARSYPPSPPLAPEASVQLRDRLLGEINALGSGDDAALWAHRCLPEKNRLSAGDAQRVEQSFQAKLTSLAPANPAEVAEPLVKMEQGPIRAEPQANRPKKQTRSKPVETAIDKSALALPEPRRVRDRDHVRYVATQPCLVCGRQPSDTHHLRFAQSRALGRKVSDEFTVPLCRGHHREVHRRGDEAAWWKAAGLDPIVAARVLWLETHPLTTTENSVHEAAPTTINGTDKKNANRDRPVRKRGPNDKTNPIGAAGPR
jgi:ERF superfamily